MTDLSKPCFVTLPGRGKICVSGPDAFEFLQALVSQDLHLLDAQPMIYACLLTAQGKFLHDFLISRDGEEFIIDCEGGDRATDLHRRLGLYKLRSKLSLSCEENVEVYALLGMDENNSAGLPDPRHPHMGRRSHTAPDGMTACDFNIWDEHRIRLGIPDGSRDMQVEQSTLLECNIDRLHGISFKKGCYVGQELTARMHHRGLAKKHLYAVEWHDRPPQPGNDVEIGGKIYGTARSACGHFGMVLLKDEVITLPGLPFTIIGRPS